VLDESAQPVAGADVHFQWTNLSAKGTADSDVKTDARGRFFLDEVQGKRLGVRIVKPGYYSSDSRNQWSFEYANPYEEVFYEPRQEAPVVFHLRKQNAAADVVSKSTEVKLSGDGSTVRVRLDNGKPGAEGELVIQAWKPWPPRPMSPPYDWKVELQIDGGGFANAPEQFAFEAPETGYEPVFTIDMRAALTAEWKVSVERTLYFTVGEPKKYGRLSLKPMATADTFFSIMS